MRFRARNILPLSQRQILRARVYNPAVNDQTADIVGPDQWVHTPYARVNKAEADAKTMRYKSVLDAGSPQDESPAYKRWRDKRVKELEERLGKDVIPRDTFHMKREDSTAYRNVVGTLKNQMQDSDRQSAETELQNLRREREPEDAEAGKLSYLREDRRITV